MFALTKTVEAMLRCKNWTHLADQQTRSTQWHRLSLTKWFWHQIKAQTNGFPETDWQHQYVKCRLGASFNQRLSGAWRPSRGKMSLRVKSWIWLDIKRTIFNEPEPEKRSCFGKLLDVLDWWVKKNRRQWCDLIPKMSSTAAEWLERPQPSRWSSPANRS